MDSPRAPPMRLASAQWASLPLETGTTFGDNAAGLIRPEPAGGHPRASTAVWHAGQTQYGCPVVPTAAHRVRQFGQVGGSR
jgi:hypothetical protein